MNDLSEKMHRTIAALDLRSRVRQGLLASVDVHFAGQVAALEDPARPEVVLAAALASRATADGHVCLALPAAAGQTGWPASELPPLPHWRERLHGSTVVGGPGDFAPLVLDTADRLYLYRYWRYEQRLIEGIRKRLEPHQTPEIDRERLGEGLARLFGPAPSGQDVNWQKLAAMTAVLKRFCVISGGPGTGKTHTVAKILALLLEQAAPAPLRIFLAAPTGKAAARLGESLRAAGQTIPCTPEVNAAMPTGAATLHRMLKPLPGSPYFQYNVENPLPADVVVVDEASMVDLALMAKLVQALPDDARLILIGDRDQLASVEAGAALGDICGRGMRIGYSENFLQTAAEVAGEAPDPQGLPKADVPIRDHEVQLIHSYRFSETGRIGPLSRAINRGDANAVLAILQADSDGSVHWHRHPSADGLRQALRKIILDEYGRVTSADRPEQGLAALNRFRLLCALKKGPRGSDAINRTAERWLRAAKQVVPDTSPWYAGRPVLITENDYMLGLFNGDIGLAAFDPDRPEGPLNVWFPDAAGSVRRIPAFRIGAHETVYAMTVHKSQGSEFDHVFLVLPEIDAPVLTRELLYTAVTRARRSVTLWGSETILRTAVQRKIQRSSGLREALWGMDSGS